jgi:hypothetical protein
VRTASADWRQALYRSERPLRPGPAPCPALADDREALALRRLLEAIAEPLARAAAEFIARRGWHRFGYARLADHARERFGHSGRWVRDLAEIGDGLARLPSLRCALTGEDGARPLGLVATRLIASVATEESVRAWIEISRGVPVRTLRRLVAEAEAAASNWPPDSPKPAGPLPAPAPEGTADGLDTTILIRIDAPRELRAAFEETLDLFRALEGGSVDVAGFVEALTAEALSGPHPPDVECSPVDGVSRRDERREESLARWTRHWAHLPAPLASAAGDAVETRRASETGEGGSDRTSDRSDGRGEDPDTRIRALLKLQGDTERRLAALLARMTEEGAWRALRFASLEHYAEERLGWSRTSARERVRLERALRRLPILRQAYDTDQLGPVAALAVARLLEGDPDVSLDLERAWVERATHATVKRLLDEVRAVSRAGAGTGLSGPAELDLHRRAAAVPSPLSDAEWHASLERRPGMARRRVHDLGCLAVRATCGGSDDPPGPLPGRLEALLLRLPEDVASPFLAAVESARRRLALAATNDLSGVCADSPAPVLAARTFSLRGRAVPAWVGLLAMLEEFVDTWDSEPASSRGGPRQWIYARDGWRCAAPGCTSRRNLEDHHVVHRSRGGGDSATNRTCLCRFHHQRGEHGGLARCRGTAPLGLLGALGANDIGGTFLDELRIWPHTDPAL